MDTDIILKSMLDRDEFSKWLGLQIETYSLGFCKLNFVVRPEMLNGFDIVHGGVVFAAADSAFAFACNSQGILSVALDVHISFIKSAKAGEKITVEAKEISTGNRVGFYEIHVTNQEGAILAVFNGTAYRTGKTVVNNTDEV